MNEWKSSGSGQENRINGRGDPLRWPRDTLYPQKLAIIIIIIIVEWIGLRTESRKCGHSIGIWQMVWTEHWNVRDLILSCAVQNCKMCGLSVTNLAIRELSVHDIKWMEVAVGFLYRRAYVQWLPTLCPQGADQMVDTAGFPWNFLIPTGVLGNEWCSSQSRLCV
jgi:hypothetical protein